MYPSSLKPVRAPHFLHLLLQTLQSLKAGDKEQDNASQKQLVIKPGSLPMLPSGFRGETVCQRRAVNAVVQPAAFVSSRL